MWKPCSGVDFSWFFVQCNEAYLLLPMVSTPPRRNHSRHSAGETARILRQYVPIRTVLGLDLGRTFDKKSLVLFRTHSSAGVPFTRERSRFDPLCVTTFDVRVPVHQVF